MCAPKRVRSGLEPGMDHEVPPGLMACVLLFIRTPEWSTCPCGKVFRMGELQEAKRWLLPESDLR